jgi:ribosomal protein L37AE/L43A
MRVLGCPNCGSPIETRTDGSCRNCDTVITDGRLQWQVIEAGVLLSEPAPPLELTRGAGVEEGTNLPMVVAPDLPGQLRAFRARHPEFDWDTFRARVTEVFTRIQESWSAGTWEGARPFETDFLFQQHRYWIERYAAEGLRNRMDHIAVTDVVLAKITVDAYLESVTVRIFARMRDWTEDRSGKLVGGSRSADRVFSEYWTFIRSAGKTARPREQVDTCPNCGAPLDRISETGVCGYCEAKITGGEYDWVLSTIDQDEAYRG